MGSRGASGNSGKAQLAAARQYADKKTNDFIERNGMSSDGEINGVFEEAFISEALRNGVSKEKINTEINGISRTDGIDYMGGFERNARRNIESIVSQSKNLKASDFKTYRPKGWKVIEGATTAPKGYKWVSNGKSMFGGEYEQALVPKTTL